MSSNDNKRNYANDRYKEEQSTMTKKQRRNDDNNGNDDDGDSSTVDFSSELEEKMNLLVNSDEELLIW
jgi:hypothetical protein